MKKITNEFKTFIKRGSVIDMSVGIIVGSAFTAVVNSMSNNVLKPLINLFLTFIFGADSLSDVYTILKPVYDEAGDIILEESVYIDWGSFINAVVNFFVVAVVLFVIVKVVNTVHKRHKEIVDDILDDMPTRADRREMKKRGISLIDRDAVEVFMNEKKHRANEEAELERQRLEEEAQRKREECPTTEDLLKDILAVLKENKE